MLPSTPSSSSVAAEGENLTALHEYRETILVTSREHLLKALIAESFESVFPSVWKELLTNAWSVKTVLDTNSMSANKTEKVKIP